MAARTVGSSPPRGAPCELTCASTPGAFVPGGPDVVAPPRESLSGAAPLRRPRSAAALVGASRGKYNVVELEVSKIQ